MMSKSLLWSMSLLATLSLVACGGNGGDDDGDDAPAIDAPVGGGEVRVTDSISANTTWTANNVYVLARNTYVFVAPGATLTIEAGTRIEGEQGSLLVVSRGGKIMAEGTLEKPIVMTSRPQNKVGLWGGLLVLGAARINNNVRATEPSTEATYEAFPLSETRGKFGGTNDDDNSGVIRYVRIEFGGFAYAENKEFNTCTFAGVGRGTVIDFLQCHSGADDGVEIFGGTVNLKHVVATQNQDDGWDTDNGWQGNAQWVIVQHVSPLGTDASNGYESDNHATSASYTADPRTLPTMSNVTVIGSRDYTGGASLHHVVKLRRGTGGKYYNHVFVDFAGAAEMLDQATKDQLDAGNLFFKNSIFFNNGADGMSTVRSVCPPAPAADCVIDEELYLFPVPDTAGINNRRMDPMLPAGRSNKTSPVFKPSAVTECGAPPTVPGNFFDVQATYCGAVGANDWTAGWTAYPQPQ